MENNPQGYIVRSCLVAATEGVRGRFACLFVLNKLNQNKKMKNQKQNKKTQTVNLPWKRASVTVSQRSLESWVIACTAASVTCGTARLLLFATTYLAECTAGGKQDCGSRTWRDCVATKIADQADGGMHVLLKEKKKKSSATIHSIRPSIFYQRLSCTLGRKGRLGAHFSCLRGEGMAHHWQVNAMRQPGNHTSGGLTVTSSPDLHLFSMQRWRRRQVVDWEKEM